MMGSGKTTVGRMLAEGLGAYRWMDLDMFVEGKMGKTAAQVCVCVGVFLCWWMWPGEAPVCVALDKPNIILIRYRTPTHV